MGTIVATETYTLACCVFQIVSQKIASDINKFPEISIFSGVMGNPVKLYLYKLT